MPTIYLDHVSKFYKPKRKRKGPVHQDTGVEDVELNIHQGEFVFVVGGRGVPKPGNGGGIPPSGIGSKWVAGIVLILESIWSMG